MENIFTAIFLLLLPVGREDRKLFNIIIIGCIASDVAYMLIEDVALYYSVITAIACTLAIKSMHFKCAAAKVYSTLMVFQATICVMLIPSFSFEINNAVQYMLSFYNEWILTVILLSCIIGTNNIISKRLYES